MKSISYTIITIQNYNGQAVDTRINFGMNFIIIIIIAVFVSIILKSCEKKTPVSRGKEAVSVTADKGRS